MAQTGSAGIDNLVDQLREMLELIVQINAKEFNIQNVFEYKKSVPNGTPLHSIYSKINCFFSSSVRSVTFFPCSFAYFKGQDGKKVYFWRNQKTFLPFGKLL